MRFYGFPTTILAGLALGTACATERSLPQAVSDSVAVEAVVRGIIAADNRGDIDAVLSLYADDALLLPPNGRTVRGKQSIRERYATAFATYRMEVEVESMETLVAEELAVNRGRTRGRLIPHDGGEPRILDDVYVMVLWRDDEDWHITRLIWNHRGSD